MTLPGYIREFLFSCPLLADGRINVDYLGPKAKQYSIESNPVNPYIKRYIGGGGKKQYSFNIMTRVPFGSNEQQNIENNGFFEKLSAWLEEQTRTRALPDMDEKREPLSIEAVTPGYLYVPGTDNAQYCIQCKFIYNQYV